MKQYLSIFLKIFNIIMIRIKLMISEKNFSIHGLK